MFDFIGIVAAFVSAIHVAAIIIFVDVVIVHRNIAAG